MDKKNKKKTVKKTQKIDNEMEKTRQYKIKRKKHPKLRKAIKITILVLLFTIIIIAGIFIGKVYGIIKEAKISIEDVVIDKENSICKDIKGNTIAVLSGDENRETISYSEMSEYLPKAFVAIEDERFYEHGGVDIKRTAAATVTYILNGGKSSFGGSTITQQLVKNLTDEDDRTWQRKVKEMARAYYIEEELSKSQILEIYLNLIFLGGRTYGVEVASNYYFSKSASDLTLAESAFLAGINNSPNLYDAFSEEQEDKDKIIKRTKIVLDKMLELGKENPDHKAGITQEEYDTAIAELNNGIAFNKGKITQVVYSYHTDAAINQVKKELKEKNGWTDEYVDYYIKSGGLIIYTTQDTEIQTIMEEEVKDESYIEYSKYQVDSNGNAVTAQTAMVLIDHKTGYVLATVGGIGEKTTAFGLNRATQSVRQPGSTMKPLAVLCPGIDKGVITAGSVYDDIPYYSGKYANFKNYGYAYNGLTTLRYATADSKNIPMLKAINDIGVENSVEFLKSAGITSIQEHQENMTIALGSAEVSPLEMAAAYAAIANDGVYIEPTFYTKVVDSDGNVILESEQETRTIMSASTAYIVKEILTEVVRSGAGWYARISGISVGVKTGTSSDDADRWFCGFTPYYTAATWYGYDENRETVRFTINPSGYIWDGVMEQIHSGLEGKTFAETRPSNVTTAKICKSSGKLATETCEKDPRGNQVYTEYFIKGTVPTETCTCHVEVTLCKETGLIANEYCKETENKVYITRAESETGNWSKAKDAEYMLTVTDTCTTHVKEEKPKEDDKTNNPNNDNSTTGNNNNNKPQDNTTNNNKPQDNTTNNNQSNNGESNNNQTSTPTDTKPSENTTTNTTTNNNNTNNATSNNTANNPINSSLVIEDIN